MKIFISWSGDLSKRIAELLSLWIPNVVPYTEIFFSTESLSLGKPWIDGLSKALENVNFGISIVTKSNMQNPWLLYEAGAIYHKDKSSTECTLVPLLIDVSKSALQPPLGLFQAINFEEKEIKELILTINESLGERRLPNNILNVTFQANWKMLNDRVQKLLKDKNIVFNNDTKVDNDILLRRIYEYTRSLAVENGYKNSPNTLIKGFSFKERCEEHIFVYIKRNEIYEENYLSNFQKIYNYCNKMLRNDNLIKTPYFLKKTICSILDIDEDQVI